MGFMNLVFLFFLISCKSSLNSNLEASQKPPVKGLFGVTEINTFYRKETSFIPIHKVYPLNSPGMRTEFDLDHEGLGTIKGVGTCNPTKDAMALPNVIHTRSGLNGAEGILGILGVILQTKDLVDCAVHGSKPRESSMISLPHHQWFGKDRLPVNIGFAGGPNRDDANPECQKLLHVRYVKLNSNFIACIGFEDKDQNRLKIVQIQDGEIKAQRIQLMRVP